MIKGYDALSEKFLTSLDRINDRSTKVQRSIYSGYRVETASDSPSQVINIMQLRSQAERARIVEQNLQRVRAEVNTGESALNVATNLVERARTLAAQGASDFATDRKGLAMEVGQIHEQLVAITTTTAEGRYIFSGDLDQGLLYERNTDEPGGVKRLAPGTSNTRLVADVTGSRFVPAKSAVEIFDDTDEVGDPTDKNVFNAVYALEQALKAESPTDIAAASEKLSAALNHLNEQVTFYGHLQNRIERSVNSAKTEYLHRTEELAEARDTDLAQAVVDLTMLRVHQDTALAAHAKMPRTSLFDFLG